jgi:hypothetical protein
MNIKWVSKNFEKGTLTLYENNITLNQTATNFLDTAYLVMLGLDYENRALAIKPISKDEYLVGTIDEHLLYKISIGQSYSRISNKKFLKEISTLLGLDFTEKKSYKYPIEWHEKDKMLVANLNGGE